MALPRTLFVPFQDLLDPWLHDVEAPLAGRCEVELLDAGRPFRDQLDGIRVVIDQGGWGSREMLDAAAAAGVELWQVLGTGLDHFELDYALSCGLRVANTPGEYSSTGLAEHALLLMLCFARRLDEARRNAREGTFHHPFSDDLYGRSLGLIGFGASGRELASRAAAFGMRLLAVDLYPIAPELAELYGLSFAGSPDEIDFVVAESDYLSLHVPLTSSTEQLLDRRRIGLLKPSATVINVARGPLIDQAALVEALSQGKIHGAGLDVFDTEPLDPDHPLLRLENVVATPHVAGGSRETSRRRGGAVAENVMRVYEGRPILHEITTAIVGG